MNETEQSITYSIYSKTFLVVGEIKLAVMRRTFAPKRMTGQELTLNIYSTFSVFVADAANFPVSVCLHSTAVVFTAIPSTCDLK